MGSELQLAIPLLRVFSKEKTWEFYVDFLGFAFDWVERMETDGPLYAQVSRNAVILHLSGHFEDGTPGTTVLIRTHGIDALHGELTKKKYPFTSLKIVDKPWNARVMDVLDPFGNCIRFSENKL